MKGPTCLVLLGQHEALAKRLERWLLERGFEVLRAEDCWEAYRCVYVSRPAAILVATDRLSRELRDFVQTMKRMTALPVFLFSPGANVHLLREASSWPLDRCLAWHADGGEALRDLEEALDGLATSSPSQLTYEEEGLRIDFRSMSVVRDGLPVHLTPTEFRVLALLVGRRGWVVTHDEILAHVWGPEYVGDRGLVKLYIWYLRRKLEQDPARPRRILTRRGVGYMFRPQETREGQGDASRQREAASRSPRLRGGPSGRDGRYVLQDTAVTPS
ncbi:MAG TPA: winged helix-turn-helix domain-containing protein [Dehalococcoidia bacterium]|nr:winged helix-turn-helix domain-containing protein [Dehalococcoidia bacterium]